MINITKSPTTIRVNPTYSPKKVRLTLQIEKPPNTTSQLETLPLTLENWLQSNRQLEQGAIRLNKKILKPDKRHSIARLEQVEKGGCGFVTIGETYTGNKFAIKTPSSRIVRFIQSSMENKPVRQIITEYVRNEITTLQGIHEGGDCINPYFVKPIMTCNWQVGKNPENTIPAMILEGVAGNPATYYSLDQKTETDNRLTSTKSILSIATQLVTGLQLMYKTKDIRHSTLNNPILMVHGDLKPSNIMVEEIKNPKTNQTKYKVVMIDPGNIELTPNGTIKYIHVATPSFSPNGSQPQSLVKINKQMQGQPGQLYDLYSLNKTMLSMIEPTSRPFVTLYLQICQTKMDNHLGSIGDMTLWLSNLQKIITNPHDESVSHLLEMTTPDTTNTLSKKTNFKPPTTSDTTIDYTIPTSDKTVVSLPKTMITPVKDSLYNKPPSIIQSMVTAFKIVQSKIFEYFNKKTSYSSI